MDKPTLVIMAAGMGSRYGGLKQIDPVDEENNIIMDFSIYDAKKAGFEKVIFIIKKENEADFRKAIGDRLKDHIEIKYAFQDVNDLPEGYEVPEGRTKPWGTAHAVYTARDEIKGPFAVINADDYYGPEAFSKIYDFLVDSKDDDKYRYCMVGYRLENTVTDNGSVSRGVCSLDEEDYLVDIVERTKIQKVNGAIAYTEDDGESWHELDGKTPVSMNMWGFSKSFIGEIGKGFPKFLDEGLRVNPEKCEYFLPSVVSNLLEEEKASVKVLRTDDKWYGITYKEDKAVIVEAIKGMKESGRYPKKLWEGQ